MPSTSYENVPISSPEQEASIESIRIIDSNKNSESEVVVNVAGITPSFKQEPTVTRNNYPRLIITYQQMH
jgi:hypothetical protein